MKADVLDGHPLGGLTEDEHHEVGAGEAEEVVVGGRVHRLVLHDDQAHRDVARHAAHEDHLQLQRHLLEAAVSNDYGATYTFP